MPSIEDAERLQGLDAGWTKPAEKIVGRHRWRLVGNAVTVGATKWLGTRLRRPGPYDPSEDEPFATGASWPRAAWSMGHRVHVAGVTSWPRREPLPRLENFLMADGIALSRGAAEGFLTRLEASSLNVPNRLLAALRRHLGAGNRASTRRLVTGRTA
jgi:DNA (cytosine-5)-methyltransferase 1